MPDTPRPHTRRSPRVRLLAAVIGGGLMIGMAACSGRQQTASSELPADCWLLSPEQRATATGCRDAFAGMIVAPSDMRR